MHSPPASASRKWGARRDDRWEGEGEPWTRVCEPKIEEEREELDGPESAGPVVQLIRSTDWGGPGGGQQHGKAAAVHRRSMDQLGQGATDEAGAKEKRGPKNRPTGTRKKDNAEKAFITMNTSGKPQLLDNLDKLGMRKTRAVAILC